MRRVRGLLLLALVGLGLSACVGVTTPAPAVGSEAAPYPASATVVVGDVTWRLVRSYTAPTLPGLSGLVHSTAGRFVVVVVTWTYHGQLSTHIDNAALYDDQDNEYQPLFTPVFDLDPPASADGHLLRREKPRTLSIVFDVPPAAQGLRLKSYDATPEGDQLYVLLPPG